MNFTRHLAQSAWLVLAFILLANVFAIVGLGLATMSGVPPILGLIIGASGGTVLGMRLITTSFN